MLRHSINLIIKHKHSYWYFPHQAEVPPMPSVFTNILILNEFTNISALRYCSLHSDISSQSLRSYIVFPYQKYHSIKYKNNTYKLVKHIFYFITKKVPLRTLSFNFTFLLFHCVRTFYHKYTFTRCFKASAICNRNNQHMI